MTTFTEDLVASIDTRLVALDQELQRLHQAREALNDSAKHEHVAGPAPKREARRPARTPKAALVKPEVVPAGKLLTLLAGSPGLATSAIAKATNGASSQILELLKELEQQNTVRRTGERRATRWFVMTEEDLVAQRAAEIIERTKKPKPRRARKS